MLEKAHNQFKVRGGRAIKMAAALCVAGGLSAAGLAFWCGNTEVLSQVTGVNPTAVSEGQQVNNVLCEQGTICTTDNYNYGCDFLMGAIGAPCSEVTSGPSYNYSCNSLYPMAGAVCYQWTVSPCVTYTTGTCTNTTGGNPYCDTDYGTTRQVSTYEFCVQEYP